MTRRSLVPRLAVLGVLILAIAGGSARADLFVFDSSNGDPNPGPYGTVSVTGGGSSVTITVNIAAGYQLNNFAFNVASGTQLSAPTANTPFSLALTGTSAGAASWGYSPGNDSSGVGQQNQGGLGPFGKYSYTVGNSSDTGVTQAIITITGTSLTLSQFEGSSSNGSAVFAAHLKPTSGGNTFMYGAHLVPVPEPATFAIAGLGALGFLGYGLRRRAK